MQNLNGKRVVITGGSQGLGLAMVEALAACGANVTAIGRDQANLTPAEHAGAAVIAGDATDATLMNCVVRQEVPDVLILNAGEQVRADSLQRTCHYGRVGDIALENLDLPLHLPL